ncbi:MAG TPA: DUF362 domain-containing protein [Candidatus Methanomethylicus sp.]|nr:DUF362 domain-containing protein [Candidatus Methanomethylicus sp.]
MVSKVYFFDFCKSSDALRGVDALLKAVLRSGDLRGRRTAVKAHFGELGNYTHIRPQFVRRVVDIINADGGAPFATDTTTLYPTGKRLSAAGVISSARYNGFTEEGLGCPIAVADAPDGEAGTAIDLEELEPGTPLRRIMVARQIAEAGAMVVMSHVKGHLLSGLGGAIKNLGMGCTTKGCKASQHAMHGLVFVRDGCTMCGKCAAACQFGALEMGADGPVKSDACVYCLTCMWECETGSIRFLPDGKARFQEGLAMAAAGVSRMLAGRPVVYLNFLLDVTPLCDCAAPAGQPVFQNAGILASCDPVAADKASLDILDRTAMIPGLDQAAPDVLGKLNGTSSLIQLRAAERLRIGSMDYELIAV